MKTLKNTRVYRGGSTASGLSEETSACSMGIDVERGTLDFEFEIGAAGGGTTQVRLEIGPRDLPAILKEIAKAFPSTAPVFLECGGVALGKVLSQP